MVKPSGVPHTPPAPARVWVLLASEANTAVILRRGPSRWTRLYSWNTRTDTMTPGSWFAGRLYEWMSDLSPDGQHMTYVARNESKRRVQAAAERFKDEHMWAWTALCKPPWVRALGLWNASDGWSGGGIFTDNHSLNLNHALQGLKAQIQPSGFTIRASVGHRESVVLAGLKRTGWRMIPGPPRDRGTQKSHAVVLRKGDLELRFDRSPRHKEYVTYAWHGKNAVPLLDGASWADFDQRGRLVLAHEGRLYTIQGTVLRELMDLNLDQPARRLNASERAASTATQPTDHC